MSVNISWKLFYIELEECKLLVNYARTVNYNLHHMCVRKVDSWARTQAGTPLRGTSGVRRVVRSDSEGYGRFIDWFASQTGTVVSKTSHMVYFCLIHEL